MSAFNLTVVLLLMTTFLFSNNEASYMVYMGHACTSEKLVVHGGRLAINGKTEYTINCAEGYLKPLGGENESYVYTCLNGSINKRLPRMCVARRYAYRKIGFRFSFIPKPESFELCNDNTNLVKLEIHYNTTFNRYKALGIEYDHKLYIDGCSLSSEDANYLTISAVITHVDRWNVTRDDVTSLYALAVMKSYNYLLDILIAKGYMNIQKRNKTILLYNKNYSVVAFHCDDHLELLTRDGEQVCVGCGKGFWMNMKTRKCHPCGPGFFTAEDTSVACTPCPIQYEKGVWSATNINDCFKSRHKIYVVSRFLESTLVPVIYLVVVALVISIRTKFPNLRIKCIRNKQKSKS